MSFKGPSIIKVNGGLGQTAPSDRNVAGLIIQKGYVVGTTFVADTVYKLQSLDDATALGLNAASDANVSATNACAAWYHISEFFRLNPDGTLYVWNGGAGTTPFAAGDAADQLMAASANGIRIMGLVYGFDPAATPVTTGGFGGTVAADIAAAQVWAEAKAAAYVYVDCVVVEGYAASATLVDLKAMDAPQVHVTVACDHGYFTSYPAGFKRSAAVGMVLGSIGVRALSESIGSVTLARYPDSKRGSANYSLVDARLNRWVTPGLSTQQLFDDLSQTVRDNLTANAYGYAGKYEGYAGVYYNADATCTLATDDYNTIHINRLWNEAARGVRRALTPRMNSRVRIDPSTGKIASGTIADWDAACKRELETLLIEGEIADYTFRLDPDQDVIAQGKVVTRVRIVPQGIAKAIEAEIGFTNPAQA